MNRISDRFTMSYSDTKVLLIGDVVRVDFPNSVPAVSHKFTMQVQQDGIGGRSITGWMKEVTFIGDELDTTANHISLYEFSTSNGGANWVCRITTSTSQGVTEGNNDGDIPIWNTLLGRYIPMAANIGTGAGSSQIQFLEYGPAYAGLTTEIDIPENCIRCFGVLIAGGASGGGGGTSGSQAGVNALGGAGGNPGSVVVFDIPVSLINNPVTLSIGSGGSQVAGSSDTSPTRGVDGGDTSFGHIVARGGLAGEGHVVAFPTEYANFLGHAFFTGPAGSSGGNPLTISSPIPTSFLVPTGGGGGGGKAANGSSVAGANGGAYVQNPFNLPMEGASGGSPAGGHGAAGITNAYYLGMGGGGGGARSIAGRGGNGGNGGYPGGGGGGGGAGTDAAGGDSGRGAAGWALICFVIQPPQ